MGLHPASQLCGQRGQGMGQERQTVTTLHAACPARVFARVFTCLCTCGKWHPACSMLCACTPLFFGYEAVDADHPGEPVPVLVLRSHPDLNTPLCTVTLFRESPSPSPHLTWSDSSLEASGPCHPAAAPPALQHTTQCTATCCEPTCCV